MNATEIPPLSVADAPVPDMPKMINGIPVEVAFAIMFVSVGMSCFIWQSIRSGWMLYHARKPIHAIVFAQAVLGVAVTFVTLLTSLVEVDCTFRLLFSVVGVNLGDIALQSVLLWKAYIGNNRSKSVLIVGSLPLIALVVFIGINMTFGKSSSTYGAGVCLTDYPMYIAITKATIDFTSNTFLSWCFILVIYRHYRVLGNSIHKTLIKEGLIYSFGVCLSNILTGIFMTLRILGGNTPILYTIDWYFASYLIIKQLKVIRPNKEDDEDDEDDLDDTEVASQSPSSRDLEGGEKHAMKPSKHDTLTSVLSAESYHNGRATMVSQFDNTSRCESPSPTLNNVSSFRYSQKHT